MARIHVLGYKSLKQNFCLNCLFQNYTRNWYARMQLRRSVSRFVQRNVGNTNTDTNMPFPTNDWQFLTNPMFLHSENVPAPENEVPMMELAGPSSVDSMRGVARTPAPGTPSCISIVQIEDEMETVML
jgi:hypothetical protein